MSSHQLDAIILRASELAYQENAMQYRAAIFLCLGWPDYGQ